MEVHIAPIRETDPKLAALPRRGWRSNKAWARLRRATPLLLEGQGSVDVLRRLGRLAQGWTTWHRPRCTHRSCWTRPKRR